MDTRVAIYLPSLEGGGAEKCLLTLAQGLHARGVRVTFVLANGVGPYLEPAAKLGEVVDLGTRSVPMSIPHLARYLSRQNPDALISGLEHANTASLIAKSLASARTRTLVTTHTMISRRMDSRKRVRSRILIALMHQLYPAADVLVAVSRAAALDLSRTLRLPEESIHVIYNPVPLTEIASESKAPVDQSLFGPGSPPVVLAVGGLWPYKDHKTLIDAFAIARTERPLRLVILGEGPERSRLQGQIKRLGLQDQIILPGFVANPYSWMANAAVFVLPSKWEGLPTVLVEALACGTSCVATDSPGGTAEILENGTYGRLTPPGNPSLMSLAILSSLDHPFDPRRLVKRAADFSVERATESYLDLINGSPSRAR